MGKNKRRWSFTRRQERDDMTDTPDHRTAMTPSQAAAAAGPPPQPTALDPAMIAAMVDHRWGVAGQLDQLTKPITVVVAANGVFELRKNRLGVAVKELVKLPSAPMGLTEKLQEGYILSVPKVPLDCYKQIVAFFRDVNDAYHTEAMVQVWFNHDTQQHELYVPLQDVSAGMVQHAGDRDRDLSSGNLSHMMDIHSHHTMNAFWSGTDDADEARNERLYGVIGKITQLIPESSWRARTAGKFIPLAFGDIIDVPAVNVTFSLEDFTYPLVDLLKTGAEKVTLSFPKGTALDPFKDVTYPKSDWWAQLITDHKDPRRIVRDPAPNRGNWRNQGAFWDKRDPFGGAGVIDRTPRPMTHGRHLGTGPSADDGDGWEQRIIGSMLNDPRDLAICTHYRSLNQAQLFVRHVPHANPAGYAIFYQAKGGIRERAPFAEEKAILGTFPQAGFVALRPNGEPFSHDHRSHN